MVHLLVLYEEGNSLSEGENIVLPNFDETGDRFD